MEIPCVFAAFIPKIQLGNWPNKQLDKPQPSMARIFPIGCKKKQGSKVHRPKLIIGLLKRKQFQVVWRCFNRPNGSDGIPLPGCLIAIVSVSGKMGAEDESISVSETKCNELRPQFSVKAAVLDLQVSISLSSKSQHQTAHHILLKNLRVSAWFHSWTISFRVVIFPADVQKSQTSTTHSMVSGAQQLPLYPYTSGWVCWPNMTPIFAVFDICCDTFRVWDWLFNIIYISYSNMYIYMNIRYSNMYFHLFVFLLTPQIGSKLLTPNKIWYVHIHMYIYIYML